MPRNLCAAIPEGVSFEEAAFVALGGIALHAAHLSGASLGEDVAVLGLGPVGLLLAQVLRAAGCRVAGFDLRADRLAFARQLGIERAADADRSSLRETLRGWGMSHAFDRIFIAAASSSGEPVEWAVEAAADRAMLVVVGDVRTEFPRNACYAKELRIAYARSYGPGRYDPMYEARGDVQLYVDEIKLTGAGALRAACNAKVYGIGVDVDQWQSLPDAQACIITSAENHAGYGRLVVIDHGFGITTWYAHLSSFSAVAGARVKRGEVVGYTGISGRSTGPHVHYEVRMYNAPINPWRYMKSGLAGD